MQKAFDDFISGTMKMTDNKTVRRILHFKFTLPSADNVQFLSAMKNAAPHAAIFGDMKIRFLQNADNPAKIIQIVEYDAPESMEADPRVQTYLQVWRTIVPNVEMDVYREIEG